MLKIVHDVARAKRWQKIRRKIRSASGHERYRLLRRFGDEIRAISPLVAKASAQSWDMAAALELSTMQGVVIGGWAEMSPANPDWPGRDRIFLTRKEDLVTTCAILSTLGFFPSDQAAALLDQAEADGRDAVIPGIECPGARPAETMAMAWESAVESGRSKRRWRDRFAKQNPKWAEPWWRESPAAWRTCVAADAGTPHAELLRDFPLRGGERPAGFVALLMAPRNEADALAEQWARSGWETETINRTDCVTLYHTLIRTPGAKPLAVFLATAQPGSQNMTRIRLRRKEAELLAELSDDQFNALMGETLRF